MGRKIIENVNSCPITHAMNAIGGKWKPIIIYQLSLRTLRFGKLMAFIPNISKKVLSDQLKEMTADGLIIRERFAEVPPRVEYSLAEKGHKLVPILMNLAKWSMDHLSEVVYEGDDCRL